MPKSRVFSRLAIGFVVRFLGGQIIWYGLRVNSDLFSRRVKENEIKKAAAKAKGEKVDCRRLVSNICKVILL